MRRARGPTGERLPHPGFLRGVAWFYAADVVVAHSTGCRRLSIVSPGCERRSWGSEAPEVTLGRLPHPRFLRGMAWFYAADVVVAQNDGKANVVDGSSLTAG